jgi:hypothetical protein
MFRIALITLLALDAATRSLICCCVLSTIETSHCGQPESAPDRIRSDESVPKCGHHTCRHRHSHSDQSRHKRRATPVESVPPAPNPPEPQTPPCECEISSYLGSLQKQRRDTSNSCELAICRPSFREFFRTIRKSGIPASGRRRHPAPHTALPLLIVNDPAAS